MKKSVECAAVGKGLKKSDCVGSVGQGLELLKNSDCVVSVKGTGWTENELVSNSNCTATFGQRMDSCKNSNWRTSVGKGTGTVSWCKSAGTATVSGCKSAGAESVSVCKSAGTESALKISVGGFKMLWVWGFFAKLLNHSMFEIPIVLLCVNNAEVDFLGQFEDSGAKFFLFGEVSFGKLYFEEVEPIFWFHLLEGANLNVSHCGKLDWLSCRHNRKGVGLKWTGYPTV